MATMLPNFSDCSSRCVCRGSLHDVLRGVARTRMGTYTRRVSTHRTDVPSLYEWAGGDSALLRLTRCFYGTHVPPDPLLGPLFAGMAPDHPERVAAWLGEVFGGPAVYSERYGGYAH